MAIIWPKCRIGWNNLAYDERTLYRENASPFLIYPVPMLSRLMQASTLRDHHQFASYTIPAETSRRGQLCTDIASSKGQLLCRV